MNLNVNDSKLISSPSQEVVLEALQNLGIEEYAILESKEEVYVQTRRDDESAWCLEYRNGSEDEHYGIDPDSTTIEDVCQAFAAFLNGEDLAPLFDWETVNFDDHDHEPGEGEVIYNGVIMDEEWPAEIEAAQSIETIELEGEVFKRIRFGSERDMPIETMEHCGDCGVLKGQLHVPECDIEQCPKCFEHLMSCGHADDES
ncbi:hypothetical protein LOC67_17305 [Stieleria sp. JC731]|uniref:hypothetical protein n=1 Tax=Pirellulaceae TaxID=2691357 RepID=UPI001E44F394|nr:hypothetical protein [Stieleria sp. JC731]MCC9602315.1 hypothetical protein [Stieleria sp. JC731]